MFQRLLLAIAIVVTTANVWSDEPSHESPPSYTITINPGNYRVPVLPAANQAYEFSSLAVDFANIKLDGKDITVVPFSVELGLTGAVLIGDGTYAYTPAAGQSFTGRFRAVMLRFSPSDADAIIKLSAGKAVVDKGAVALARSVLAATFRHCFHTGEQVLIPSQGSLAADVFSRELGEVLFDTDGKKVNLVFDFTDGKVLYEKK